MTCVVALASSFIDFSSILMVKEARENTFNTMVVFLVIPDFLFSGLCGANCLLNYLTSSVWGGKIGCDFQATYVIFGIAFSV